MGLLEYIRSRDSDTKAHLSLFISGGVTLLIGVVWMSTFSARMTPISLDSREKEDMSEKYTESRNFGDIIDNAKSQLGTLMNAKEELTNSLEEVVTYKGEFDETHVVDDGSALGTLTMPEEVIEEKATSTVPQSESPVVLESTPETTPVVVEGSKTPEQPKEPRVILIGTTTSQKTE